MSFSATILFTPPPVSGGGTGTSTTSTSVGLTPTVTPVSMTGHGAVVTSMEQLLHLIYQKVDLACTNAESALTLARQNHEILVQLQEDMNSLSKNPLLSRSMDSKVDVPCVTSEDSVSTTGQHRSLATAGIIPQRSCSYLSTLTTQGVDRASQTNQPQQSSKEVTQETFSTVSQSLPSIDSDLTSNSVQPSQPPCQAFSENCLPTCVAPSSSLLLLSSTSGSNTGQSPKTGSAVRPQPSGNRNSTSTTRSGNNSTTVGIQPVATCFNTSNKSGSVTSHEDVTKKGSQQSSLLLLNRPAFLGHTFSNPISIGTRGRKCAVVGDVPNHSQKREVTESAGSVCRLSTGSVGNSILGSQRANGLKMRKRRKRDVVLSKWVHDIHNHESNEKRFNGSESLHSAWNMSVVKFLVEKLKAALISSTHKYNDKELKGACVAYFLTKRREYRNALNPYQSLKEREEKKLRSRRYRLFAYRSSIIIQFPLADQQLWEGVTEELMSDEEDSPVEPGVWVARVPSFRSAQLSELICRINANSKHGLKPNRVYGPPSDRLPSKDVLRLPPELYCAGFDDDFDDSALGEAMIIGENGEYCSEILSPASGNVEVKLERDE
ncbi:uncharacterized protein C14orf93 homolog [Erpetoichthys calabaricus]|uniref:uncharacterized protein C14orf93 homolog n=1 Tax=Erpetoichthys calabaricus TaxID=27687 RepID=UPI002234B4E6|nr:uncharacterized protein C14orf93 homolog [Erpetoichthys calabaricus]